MRAICLPHTFPRMRSTESPKNQQALHRHHWNIINTQKKKMSPDLWFKTKKAVYSFAWKMRWCDWSIRKLVLLLSNAVKFWVYTSRSALHSLVRKHFAWTVPSEGVANGMCICASWPIECQQDAFTCPTTAAAPVPAGRVNPSWYFPKSSNSLFTKLMIADFASYNFVIALKRTAL